MAKEEAEIDHENELFAEGKANFKEGKKLITIWFRLKLMKTNLASPFGFQNKIHFVLT